jgi:hypothetical protein
VHTGAQRIQVPDVGQGLCWSPSLYQSTVTKYSRTGVSVALPHRVKIFMRAFSKKYKDKANRQEESTDKTCALVLSKQSRNPHTRPCAMRMLSGRTVVVVVLTRSITLLALTLLL